MHHALDAVLELHERAVRNHAHHLAVDLAADGVFHLDVVPRVAVALLEPERYALLFAVHFQNHHFDRVAHLEQFGRMIDPSPAHVRDVQQSVETIEVDECAEVREVLDQAAANLPDLHAGQQRPALVFAFLLDQFAPRQHNVVAFLVDLDHLELESLAEKIVEVAGRNDINLRGGEESVDADVHHQSALHFAADLAIDGPALGTDAHDPVPVLLLLGAGIGQHDHPVVVLDLLQQHLDLVAHLHGIGLLELRERNRPILHSSAPR